MRSSLDAPVDSMGCEKISDPTARPQVTLIQQRNLIAKNFPCLGLCIDQKLNTGANLSLDSA